MTAGAVVPIYIALDESSASAARYYSSGLRELRDRLLTNPLAADPTRFTILSVSGEGSAASRWLSVGELTVPAMNCEAQSFGAASLFRTLRATLNGDLAVLRRAGGRVYRPVLFVVAASAPDEPWEAAFRELTYYDAVSRSGFSRYPLVVPISLTEAADVAMSAAAFPPDRVISYVARQPGDLSAAVTATFALIGNVIDLLWAALPASTPMRPDTVEIPGALRASRDLADPDRREPHDEDQPGRSDVDRPQRSPTEALDGQQEWPQYETQPTGYLQMRCSGSGAPTWNRFVNRESTWLLAQPSATSSAQTHEAARALTGQFGVEPEYSGCAHCGGRSYAKCDCGRLSCWDGSAPTYFCHWCHRSIRLNGSITSAQAVD